jgi:hypothetical protein
LESIDISNPASLKPLQIASMVAENATCHALPIAVHNNLAYVGCYAEGLIDQFDISNPSSMRLTKSISGVAAPQRLLFAGNYLLVPGSVSGGQVYQIETVTTLVLKGEMSSSHITQIIEAKPDRPGVVVTAHTLK